MHVVLIILKKQLPVCVYLYTVNTYTSMYVEIYKQ